MILLGSIDALRAERPERAGPTVPICHLRSIVAVDLSLAVDWVRLRRAIGGQLAALVAATLLVMLLERGLGVRQASSVYLLAVASVAIAFGSVAAVGTAIGAFLTYNFLFVSPYYTFTVGEPNEIVTLLLLLVLGLVISELTGAARGRAEAAMRSEREARATAEIARRIGEARRLREALPPVLDALRAEVQAARAWLQVTDEGRPGQPLADTGEGELPDARIHHVVRRGRSGRDAWLKISGPGAASRDAEPAGVVLRVPMERAGEAAGALWLVRVAATGLPNREETRLLIAAADIVAQAIDRDRLATRAVELEVARRADEAKTALLDSVSHDLRTPLAAIRAAAGTLADPAVTWTDVERRATASDIDAQAAHLAGMVSALLDMSRIRTGSLAPRTRPVPVDELITSVAARFAKAGDDGRVSLDLPGDLPLVLADPVLLEQALANVLDNALRHAGGAAVAIACRAQGTERLELLVDDAGPGIGPGDLARLNRGLAVAAARPEGASGMGLAIVRGFVEAMHGSLAFAESPLGGLRVRIELPVAAR